VTNIAANVKLED